MLELEGRTAVVTGAGSGIGRSLALLAGERQMHVMLADIDEKGLAETADILRKRQIEVTAEKIDVADDKAMQSFAETSAGLPELALVWANAGIIRYNSAIKPDLAAWNEIINVNLRGAVNTMAAFIPKLSAQQSPSRFIFTGSQASFMAAPEIGAYTMTKHAVWGLAETLRIELEMAGSLVGVSMLAPPRTASAMIQVTMDRVKKEQGEEGLQAFLAALPQPEDVAAAAYDGALRGDFLILPHYDQVHAMVSERLQPLV